MPIIALALFPSPVTAVAALVVIGIADPWVNLGLETIPQRLAPSHAISRVYAAVESIAIAAMALGSLLAPLLIHLFGTSASLIGMASSPFIAGFVGGTSIRVVFFVDLALMGILAATVHKTMAD